MTVGYAVEMTLMQVCTKLGSGRAGICMQESPKTWCL